MKFSAFAIAAMLLAIPVVTPGAGSGASDLLRQLSGTEGQGLL